MRQVAWRVGVVLLAVVLATLAGAAAGAVIAESLKAWRD